MGNENTPRGQNRKQYILCPICLDRDMTIIKDLHGLKGNY